MKEKQSLIRKFALKLRALKKGEELFVATDTERRVAKLAASAIDIEVHSCKHGNGYRLIVI